MTIITWNTPVGSLGTIKELDYFEFPLSATTNDSSSLEFTHISGNMPEGMRVSKDGYVKGVPVVTTAGASKSVTYTFTVRANTPSGVVADRTFYIVVNNFSSLKIYGKTYYGSFDDGRYVSYQFTAITENPNATLTWSVINGELPIDSLTGEPLKFDSNGLLSGYIGVLQNVNGQPTGYDSVPSDVYPYDFNLGSLDKRFTFTIQVTDGTNFDVASVTLYVVHKGSFSADNAITIVNNDTITVDVDNKYPPIITTDPSVIPTLTAGDRFAFKFNGYDPVGDTIAWAANSSLPNGLTISSVTGWLTGSIPQQTETEKSYTFGIYAYKKEYSTVKSVTIPVTINVVKNNTDNITWITNENAGTITNGSVSELSISAVNNAGKEVVYSMVSGAPEKLPQGLKLLSNGDIIGRSTFEYFSLDGHSANITVASTAGITVGMIVEGPGIASGCQVIAVVDANTVTIEPATYATEGSEITFTDGFTNIVTQLTDLSTTTTIDKGATTFDCTFKFTVKAETVDNSVSSIKTFYLTTNNYNRAPYENLYLKAFPSIDQRKIFNDVMANQDIFPDSLLYRSQDPWFGKATDIKLLFLAGVTASTLAELANGIELNHYNKQINFGNIKTARALDANFNTKYEVVYLDVTDTNAGDSLVVEPAIKNYYLDGNNSYHTIYPNTFDNMEYRVKKNIGFANRGALPDWMTSPQEDGKVLGLTRAVVLAYTVPGASKLIAYRLKNNGIKFSNIQFVADRYQVDAGITDIYDPTTNRFYPATETTFDLASGNETIFDANTTNFFNQRYKYSEPEVGDKYIKWSQTNVYT